MLKGLAADLHFGGYKLEYADANSPDSWTLIQPPSEITVLNDDFCTWIPPQIGTYLVRLSVWDKAGNILQTEKKIAWSENSPIANLYKTESVFSPNVDGVKDVVEFRYTVLEPLQLEFFIYDANDQLVRRFTRNHPLTGEQTLPWDGTDDQGGIVGDGIYKIKVLEYELLVEVDTTPPHIDLSTGLLKDEHGRFTSVLLTGHADDKNLGSWSVVHRDQNSSGDWISFKQGDQSIGSKPVSGFSSLATENVAISGFDAEGMTTYGGKIFRLSAEDRAGNRSSVLAGPLEGTLDEIVDIYAWDLERLSSDILARSKTRPGHHVISAFETIRAALSEVALEYRVEEVWLKAAATYDVSGAGITVSWDSSSVSGAPNALRLKVVDSTGSIHYSNTLITQNSFEIGVFCDNPPTITNYILEEIAKLSYWAQRPTDGVWIEYHTVNGTAEAIPTGNSIMMGPPQTLTGGQQVQLKAVAVSRSGKSYVSNEVYWPKSCGEVAAVLKYEAEDAECGPASGRGTLHASISASGAFAATPQQLTLHRQTSSGWEVLRSFGAVPQGDATIDTSIYPEGKQVFKAVFRYVDEDGRTKEKTDQIEVQVDRALPVAQIVSPSGTSQIFCPLRLTTPGGTRLGIPVQGMINDVTGVKSYQLFYGVADHPDVWQPAKSWIGGQLKEIKGSGPLVGEIAFWDITGLPEDTYTLKLQVIDIAGNASCHIVSFHLKPPAQVAQIKLSENLISANGDGKHDVVTIDYLLTEAATVRLDVHPLVTQPDGRQVPSNTPVKTIIGGQIQASGTAEWDGTDDGGNPVADGKYAIIVSVTDVCGTNSKQSTIIEVDNTAPSAAISTPVAGQPLGSIVEVRGSTRDSHFAGYRLEVGEGAAPEAWTTLGTGISPVENGVFGVWKNIGLEGGWTLRLSGEDAAGNSTTVTMMLNLGDRQSLIRGLSADPQIFSPNGDGNRDVALVTYELSMAGQVQFEFINEADQVVNSHTSVAPNTGTYSYQWTGSTTGGTLADGEYRLRMAVIATENPAVRQEETVTITLDTAPPAIDIPNPQDQAYLSAGTLTVAGRINDRHLTEYSLKLMGIQGTTTIDAGRQNREDYTFGVLEGMPEGAYTFSATATDAAGNATEISRNFVIDRTPPDVAFTAPSANAFYKVDDATIEVTGTVREPNLAQYSLRYGFGQAPLQWHELTTGELLPNGTVTYDWNFAADQSLVDGVYTLMLRAVNKAGLEAVTTTQVTIDNQPPQVAMTAPQAGTYITAPFEVMGMAFDANLKSYHFAISEGNCATAAKWSLLREGTASVSGGALFSFPALPKDGEYCLRLAAIDRPEHESEVLVGFTIDTQPPATPELSGRIENRKDVWLEWTGGGETDLAGFNLYRNGKLLNPTFLQQSALVDSALTDGDYAYQVQAVDKAGNASELSEPFSVKIDTTPPNVRLISPGAESRIGGMVEVKGVAYSSDDFKEYRLHVGLGAEPTSWQLLRRSPVPILSGDLAQWDARQWGENAFTLKLEGEDLSGNVATNQIVVTVDNVPPPSPQLLSAITNGANVDLAWQVSTAGDLAGYLVFRNGQVANASGLLLDNIRPYLLTNLTYADMNVPDGTYDYTIVAVDAAGNFSLPSNSKQVLIETRAPQVSIVEPLNGSKFEFKTMSRAESLDNDVASIRFQYKMDQENEWIDLPGGGSSDPYRVYLDPAELGLNYGTVQLRAQATDRSGNSGVFSPIINLLYTDLTAPAVPSGLVARTDGDRVNLHWNPNNEPDFVSYRVYRRLGTAIAQVSESPLATADFADSGLADGLYAYSITSIDTYGNESAISEAALAQVYAPVLFQPAKSLEESAVMVEGKGAAPGSTINIFREAATGTLSAGTAVAAADGSFRLQDIGLSDGDNYMTAKATDAAGNISRASNLISAIYSLPPQTPTGLAGSASGYSTYLTWQPNPETDVIGYLLFRDGSRLNGEVGFTGSEVSASSFLFDGWNSYPPEWAIDGQYYTYWRSSGIPTDTHPEWFQVGLGGSELIDRLEIDWYPDPAPKRFEIQGWNGRQWITLATAQENTDLHTIVAFSPAVRVEKVRVVFFEAGSPSSTVQIAEIRFFKTTLYPTSTAIDSDLTNRVYRYEVAAVDRYGLTSPKSGGFAIPVGDLVAPATPQLLTASAEEASVRLDWEQVPNGEGDLAGYHIYRQSTEGWIKLNATPVTGNQYLDGSLRNGIYTYKISAIDQVGNESERSPEAQAEVTLPLPLAPTTLAVDANERGDLILRWQTTGAGNRFILYRSLSSGGPYVKVNSQPITATEYSDRGLTPGTGYYYVVVAADSYGNESGYSPEVFGVPADQLPPAIPVISKPIRSGEVLITESAVTEVAGTAEPGSLVELFQNGISAGKVTATEGMGSTPLVPFLPKGEHSLSPDGQYIASGGFNQLCITHLNSREQTCIPQKGTIHSPKWSPDGGRIVFSYFDPLYQMEKLAILEVSRGFTYPLTRDAAFERQPTWTVDGKVAFVSIAGKEEALWLKDLLTGTLSPLTYGMRGSDPVISPDGARVAFSSYTDLLILTIADGMPATIRGAAPIASGSLTWSADGKKLAFVSMQEGRDASGSQIHVVDVEKLESKPIASTLGSIDGLAWSPSSEKIVYFTLTYDRTSNLWNRSICIVGSDGKPTEVGSNDAIVRQFVWNPEDHIFVLADTGYFEIKIGGSFEFSGVSLFSGNNVFTASASDTANNQSDRSESITVHRETAQLPDASITTSDIRIYPPYPLPGENVMINATVRNSGQLPVTDTGVSIFLWDSTGSFKQIAETTLSAMAPNGEANISLAVKAPLQFGKNTVMVVVDPSSRITEVSEDNNYAEKEFVVTDKEEINISTLLFATEVTSNQDLRFEIALNNSGRAQEVELAVQVEDSGGTIIAVLNSANFELKFGPQSRGYSWNSGSTFAGTSQIRSVLRKGSTKLAEDVQTFVVLPDINVDAAVTTGKAAFGANQKVNIGVTLKNAGANNILSNLVVKTGILDGQNVELYRGEKTVASLWPGVQTGLMEQWNTGLTAPGAYRVQTEVYAGDKLIETASTPFTIAAEPLLNGEVTTPTSVILIGNQVKAAFMLRNSGNVSISGILQASIIDPKTLEVRGTDERSLSLPQGTAQNGEFTFSSQGLPLQAYQLILEFTGGDIQKTIGPVSFTIKDGTPPEMAILSPQAGEIYETAIPLAVQVVDNASGVARVEYQIDSGDWLALPLADPGSGRYSLALDAAAAVGGAHSVRFRAFDQAGNSSESDEVQFEIQSDKIPPITTLVLGAPSFIGPESTFVAGQTTFEFSADDDLSGVARTEYSIDNGSWQAFSSKFNLSGLAEGQHRLSYRSADNAGNLENASELLLLLDNTAPALEITIDGQGYMAGETARVSTEPEIVLSASDALSGVRATEYRFDEEPDWTTYYGAFRLAGLDAGTHTLHVRSFDKVENEAIHSVTIALIHMEVMTEIVNLPRALIWTRDPAEITGTDRPTYNIEDIRALRRRGLCRAGRLFHVDYGKRSFQKRVSLRYLQHGHNSRS